MASHVTVTLCNCEACTTHRALSLHEGTEELSFVALKYDLTFPKLESDTPPLDIAGLAKILERRGTPSDEERLKDIEQIVRFLTYLDLDNVQIGLDEYLQISEYIISEDLQNVIKDEKLAADFLRQITGLFVSAWYGLMVKTDQKVEWGARQLRRFLIHILGYEVVSNQVGPVFFNKSFWPVKGPIEILEKQIADSISCKDTLSLLVNLTRMERICRQMEAETKCIQILLDELPHCCRRMKNNEESTHLTIMLFMNLSVLDNFITYLAKEHDGFFMSVVLVDIISKPISYEEPLKVVWSLLRNLSMVEVGRATIMDNIELYLGHILYPIAGPEQLSTEENGNLPLEVSLLPPTKTRVADKDVRDCIVDILLQMCRYMNHRIILRNADVYQILKHYHLAETDSDLRGKIEDLVNVLIREEGTEIPVNDLMAGLSVQPNTSTAT